MALVLAECGNRVNQLPGNQLSTAEDSVNAQTTTPQNDAITAFDDVLPAGLAPQATSTEPSPLTLTYNGEETVLIGGPWWLPFPWPLPNGVNDLDGGALFIIIKQASLRLLRPTWRGSRRTSVGSGKWPGMAKRGHHPKSDPLPWNRSGEVEDPIGAKVTPSFLLNPRRR